MRERLERRLADLRKEFQEGQKTIADLESKLNSVRATVLRISGAIQVLEEELAPSDTDHGPDERIEGDSVVESRTVATEGA